MQALSFVPDEIMVKIQYRMKTGRKLNLRNPQRFTEKLQWYKLYYHDPLMAQCADKYEVRKYVEECGLGHILNEMYGIYNNPDEIDFSKLPDSFVIKDTLGGGGNSVILVKDKSQMDEMTVRAKMQEWINEPINKKHPGREWVYDGKKHRIIIEKYLECENGDLPDYKFYMFNGKMEAFYIRTDYFKKHGEGKIAFFDANCEQISVSLDYSKSNVGKCELPINIKEMLENATCLSKQFPHARIDFYSLNEQIIFGEITFFNGSGYFKFEPDDFDYKLGNKMNIM